jgi:glutaconate CoA-transferase subunit A
MTTPIMPLAEAVGRFVKDGQTVAMEGFTHLIPFAAGHEVIRQARKDLTLVRMTPDIIYDQLIGMGCASGLVFSWGGNPGVGSIHRFRDAIENGWPRPLAIQEHSHADMAGRYQAGASGLPFSVLRGYVGSDLPKHNPNIRTIACPFTGEMLAATPALNPDVAIIHAQKADRRGNVLIDGIVGIQKEAVLASRAAIATVEEIVDDLAAPMNACLIPHWVLSAVCHVPNGAHPSYAHGYYGRDNAFCKAWDGISRERESFTEWMKKHVLGTKDHAQFMRSAGMVVPAMGGTQLVDSRLHGNDGRSGAGRSGAAHA